MKLIAIMCFALLHKLTVAVKKGYMKRLVRTVDTDVDVVAIVNTIATLNNIKLDELWVAFGAVVHSRWNPCNMAGTLPLFHSLPGCDTESSFAGVGKKTARVTWDIYASSCEELVYSRSYY